MKIAKFISVPVFLFFALLFVSPLSAKAKVNGFSEGDRDPPFVCKQIKDPNLSLSKKRNGLSATRLLNLAPAREYEDAIGEQNILVAFVAFADQTTNTNDTSELEEKAREALFDGEESANRYFQNVSQGKMSLKGDILSGWVILPKTSEEYKYGDINNFDYNGVLKDTITAIDDRVYFPEFTRIIIFIQGEWGFGTGSVGKWDNIESDDGLLSMGICWMGEDNISYYKYDLWHELLHTFGFSHSGAIYLKDADACDQLCSNQEITKADDTTWPPLECSTEEYGDGGCVLGHGRGYPSAFIRYKSGWLNDNQILVITESTTATLIPRASSLEGIKMIIIVAKDADGTTKTYFLEYFKRLDGFDSSNKNGSKVLLRFFNEEEKLNDSGTILLLKKNEKEEENYYVTWDLKEEAFCDQENGIEIKWTSESGEEMVEENSYAELQITLSCPEAKSPAISVSPDYTRTMAGENIIVEVSVTNEMSSVGCGTRTVNLEATLPDANWSATFSPSSTLELGPGEEGTITTAIWVPESATAGSYSVAIKATDQDSGLSGESSLTIEVLRPIPTPSPTPTPTPIPTKEMTLAITVNGVDATTNSIVVAKKSWVEVVVKTSNSDGESLQVDEITCKMVRSNGTTVSKSRANGIFRFRIKKKDPSGEYTLEIEVSKADYETASFQAKFKVK